MGKGENLYVNEFIDYYMNLGVDHIFIYDDNGIKEEKFLNAITPSKLKNVSLLSSIEHSQYKSFTDCYNNNMNNFDWFLMFDLDEFLFIKNDKLKDYFSKGIFKKCDFISFNWVIPNDNNLLYYDNRSLFERFPGPYKNNKFIKTAVRGNISHLEYSVHSPLSSSQKTTACNNIGRINYKKNINYEFIKPFNAKKAFLIHFKYKSTEEFIKKYKKGYYHLFGPYLDIVLKTKLKEYLEDNEITMKKLEYIEKELNLNLTNYKNIN